MNMTKRKSLKRIAGVVVAGSGFSLAQKSLATNQYNVNFSDAECEASFSSLHVYTRVSSSTNDIEVVIANTGNESARITQMTPSQTSTARGVFNFAQLMEQGDLVIEAGQSVSVPMRKNSVVVGTPVSAAKHASSLTHSIRSSFSVITDNDTFARVDVTGNIQLS